MVGKQQRETFYGEYGEGHQATRMVHNGRHKLIYFASGNRLQLFDLEQDPNELNDLIDDDAHAGIRSDLTSRLMQQFYGEDQQWVDEKGQLIGLPQRQHSDEPSRELSLQRGSHWPVPPQSDPR